VLSGDFAPSALDSVFSNPPGMDDIVKMMELARRLLESDHATVVPLVLATQVILLPTIVSGCSLFALLLTR